MNLVDSKEVMAFCGHVRDAAGVSGSEDADATILEWVRLWAGVSHSQLMHTIMEFWPTRALDVLNDYRVAGGTSCEPCKCPSCISFQPSTGAWPVYEGDEGDDDDYYYDDDCGDNCDCWECS